MISGFQALAREALVGGHEMESATEKSADIGTGALAIVPPTSTIPSTPPLPLDPLGRGKGCNGPVNSEPALISIGSFWTWA
ncbi:hypothetical protein PoB_003620600 [Plakobranchus ocellatus]|uniref:Uncharacterized protein n=1 Tax=Plakobranchus ocellatus TaxID=259542 RepID=A0AAV4AER9_9GAST|nr:hypothetical protein PoB_003620600 [Plakobranchus ocellatus]